MKNEEKNKFIIIFSIILICMIITVGVYYFFLRDINENDSNDPEDELIDYTVEINNYKTDLKGYTMRVNVSVWNHTSKDSWNITHFFEANESVSFHREFPEGDITHIVEIDYLLDNRTTGHTQMGGRDYVSKDRCKWVINIRENGYDFKGTGK